MRLVALFCLGIGLWLGGLCVTTTASAQSWYKHYQNFRTGEWHYDDRARPDIDRALQLAPKEYIGFLLVERGRFLVRRGQFKESIEDLEKALTIEYLDPWRGVDPDKLEARAWLAQALFEMRDPRAKKELETLKSLAVKRQDRAKEWHAEQRLMQIASAEQKAEAAPAKPEPKAKVEVAAANEAQVEQANSGESSAGGFLDRLSAEESAQFEKDRAEQGRAEEQASPRWKQPAEHQVSAQARMDAALEKGDGLLARAQLKKQLQEEGQVEQAIAQKEAEVDAKVVEKAAPGGLSAEERAQIEKDRAELAGLRERLAELSGLRDRLAALEQQKVQPESAPAALPKPAGLTGRRVALVVGIDDYEAVDDLEKAVSDAELMRDTLSGLGFDVVFAKNVDRLEFLETIDSFKAKLLGPAGVGADANAFIFFAGHGVSFRGSNLLLPADAKPGSESVIQGSAIAETELIEIVRGAGAKLTVVVLDACRNNPIEERRRKLALASGNKFRNMSGMESAGLSANRTSGVFSIYSAGQGQVAFDGGPSDRNSLFTAIFARELAKSPDHLSEMMENVRAEVSKLAGNVTNPDTGLPHVQSPAFYNETLGGKIFLQVSAP